MFSQHPRIAKRWADETADIKRLPDKLKKKAEMEKRSSFTTGFLEELEKSAQYYDAQGNPANTTALMTGAGGLLGGYGVARLGTAMKMPKIKETARSEGFKAGIEQNAKQLREAIASGRIKPGMAYKMKQAVKQGVKGFKLLHI